MPFMGIFPLKVVFDEKSNVFETCSLINPSSEDMHRLCDTTYMHGKKEVP